MLQVYQPMHQQIHFVKVGTRFHDIMIKKRTSLLTDFQEGITRR
jgi:hypothetical protein